MKKKKVAIVANTTWNIYCFRLNILKRFLQENYDVYVIAPLDRYIIYKEEFPEVTHIDLKGVARKSTNPFKDLKLVLELTKIYKRQKFDLLIHYTHKPNIYGGLASFLSRSKSIAVISGLGYSFLHGGLINYITRLLYKVSTPFHKQVVFENQDDLSLFRDAKLISKNKGVYVEGCGVDTGEFSPIYNKQQKLGLTFSFIGRILYDKGVKEFVEAAKIMKAQIPQTQFWIIGDFDEGNPSSIKRAEFLSWFDPEEITYHGYSDDIKTIISKSDCIVLPSYREGMPKSLLEAMSMAKPIITTDVPGCRQTVQNNGMLVPVRDTEALAKAMNTLISLSEEERIQMGYNGRKMTLNRFNSEKISQDIYEITLHI